MRIQQFVLPACVGLVIAACSRQPTSDQEISGSSLSRGGIVRIDGSSTVYPPTEAIAEEFQLQSGARVTVGISGTGGGFKKFCRGETDVQGASRPILAEEMKVCNENGIEYVELPICFDALTVAVHPENDWVDYLSVQELKKVWEPAAQSTIRFWDQIRAGWPHQEIALFGAGSDSGTFDYFTEAIVGEAKSSRGDYTASEDDNVLVRGIAGNQHALGYLPFAYYAENQSELKAVPILWEGHTEGAVAPELANVQTGKYQPLGRPLLIYVNAESARRPEVKEFVEFYLDNGPALIAEVRYLPLPERAYDLARQRFQRLETGTVFGGELQVGLTIEEILQKELQK